MTKEELIKSLERAPVHEVIASLEEASPNEKIDKYTLLGKMNEILAYLKSMVDKGTVINVGGLPQEIIDFVTDPQEQINALEDYCNSLDSTKADAADVSNKEDYFTLKYDGEFAVNDIDDFRTKFYNQRKNTVRRWQLEINPFNIDLMSVLGYPNDGISSADKAFLYVELPYSEAGGFEIDLKLMKRDGSRVFTRRMLSTLNSNWSDTGWTNVSEPMASKQDISELVTKGNENWGMVPSDTTDLNVITKPTLAEASDWSAPNNGYIYAEFIGDGTNAEIQCRTSDNAWKYANCFSKGIQVGNAHYYRQSLPVQKGDRVTIKLSGREINSAWYTEFVHAKEIL